MRFGNLSTSRVWVMAVLLAGLGGCGGGGGSQGHGAGAASASVNPVGAASQAPLRIGMQGWYVTQAVQKLDGSVPLVAGRDGVLRVFLTANTANQAKPTVRVTITGAPGGPWQRTIPAPGASVPLALDENRLGASWNLAIPGAELVPDGHIQLEVDPEHHLDGLDAALRNVRSELDVRRVPIFRITLVPIVQSGLTGEVETGGRTRQSWTARFRAMFPVARLEVRVDVPLHTTANLNDHPGQDHDWAQLHGELEARRLARGDVGRYYYGVVKRSSAAGTHGETPVASQSAAGWDDPGGYQDTFAHEMGHALGRNHAPCGVPVFGNHNGGWPTDPAHADAALGAAGLDLSGLDPAHPDLARLVPKASPAFKDIMSYCPPYWVSDVTYKGILDWNASAQVLLDD